MSEAEKPRGGPRLPEFWLTWTATDDWDMRLRVIGTWMLFVVIVVPILFLLVFRIYFSPANDLIYGALGLAVSTYFVFGLFRLFLRPGAALLASALLVVLVDVCGLLYLLAAFRRPGPSTNF